MIRFAPTVRIVYMSAHLAEALAIASRWSLERRVDLDVNSVDDGQHGAGTLHGASLALDLDPASDRADHTRDLAIYLARQLPPPWQVVLESDHVHVEWDTGRRVP